MHYANAHIQGIKMYLNETYTIVCIRKHAFDAFFIQSGVKNKDTYLRYEIFTWNKCTKIFSGNVPHQ
jgi:hypothetical protein